MTKSLKQRHEDVPSTHYDDGFVNNFFQFIWHSRRIIELKKVIPKKTTTLLDIGCHAAFLTERILKDREFSKLYGIDISKDAIKKAKKRIPEGIFKIANIHSLPFEKNYFQTVLCIEVLEHIENPELALSEIKRVLKKNGKAIILVPTDSTLFKIIWKIWTSVYPVWQHTHIQSYHHNSLETLIKKNSFTIVTAKKFNLGMLQLFVVTK